MVVLTAKFLLLSFFKKAALGGELNRLGLLKLSAVVLEAIRSSVFFAFVAKLSLSFSVTLFSLLMLTEGAMQLGFFQPKFDFHQYDMVLDDRLLYRVIPKDGDEFDQINSHGYRDHEFSHAPTGRKRILLQGDSFVMGMGAGFDRTLAHQLEDMLGEQYEVYNMGIRGYGPDQSLMQLLDQGLAYRPDTVVLAIYAANDYGDLYRNRLVTLDEQGRAVYNPDNPVKTQLPALQTHYLYDYLKFKYLAGYLPVDMQDASFMGLFKDFLRDGYDLDVALFPEARVSRLKHELMRGVLKRYKEELDAHGIGFHVVIIPSYDAIQDDSVFRSAGIHRQKYLEVERSVELIALDLDIPVLSLGETFANIKPEKPLYFDTDHHLSEYGLEISAWSIMVHLFQRGGIV